MAVLTPIPAAPVAAPAPVAVPSASGPSCSIQRYGSLWQLGIAAQELTTAIGQLAERLETDDPDVRQQALAELVRPLCWLMKATRRPSPPRPMPPAG